ncbi:hypothetical protein TRVA0_013S02542 [Trichomonascus vanleenenianus]|uniref:Opy2p n=1 Tax=Trichomonascus vanleenenianus TaxID=2268995 RepID=UPI003ECA8D95
MCESLQKDWMESVKPVAELFKRKCVDCETPKCPACADDESCVFTTQTCDTCAKAFCQKNPSSAGSASSATVTGKGGGGPNAGAIAGGVVGGIAAVALIVAFLLWRYVYSASAQEKRRKREEEDAVTSNIDADNEYFEKYDRNKNRYTTATLSSVNTSATRASNIIPIAYIPGVSSSAHEVPPMPDMNTKYGDQFFSADDILRNSQFSENGIRSSIATTNYRGSTAVIDSAMMTAVNVKPNLVNLNSGSPASVQSIRAIQLGSAQAVNSQRANAHSVRIGRTINEEGDSDDDNDDTNDQKSDDNNSKTNKTNNNEPENSSEVMKSTPTVAEETNDDQIPRSMPMKPPKHSKDMPKSLERLRVSEQSAFEVPFDSRTTSSISVATYSTAPVAPPAPAAQRTSSRSSKRTTISRESEYLVDNLPVEAFLYTQSHHDEPPAKNDADEKGRSSPFDDKYRVE